MIITKN